MAAERAGSRTAVLTAVVWDVLLEALAATAADTDLLSILDLGGGTGGFAVPLAELGHSVTVVDPSPDSLAALERRAAETSTAHLVRGVQGDATDVVELLGAGSVDLVLCHSVLEVVDDPAQALAEVAAVLRPGGAVSLLAANRVAAVVAWGAAGRLRQARRVLADPHGSAGEGDALRRRFTLSELHDLLAEAGLEVRSSHGVRIFADAAPAALLDGDAQVVADLVALERAAADDPAYIAVATQLHVLAERR
jgi:S-adenosylmethionine-dependent methyltransferase